MASYALPNQPCSTQFTLALHTIQYNTIQYDTIRYDTIQYSTILLGFSQTLRSIALLLLALPRPTNLHSTRLSSTMFCSVLLLPCLTALLFWTAPFILSRFSFLPLATLNFKLSITLPCCCCSAGLSFW